MTTPANVALITGAATGIGKATALLLAQRGFAVAVNYSRSETEARETLDEVKALGVPGILCKANIGDDESVKAMVQQCQSELGGLDLLVNNAGTTHFVDHRSLDDLTDEVWDDIFQVNLKGTFYCCRAAMPLLEQRQGSIVNVTSVAGVAGSGSSIPYAASKAALNCMTKSLARAFAPKVRVNAVAPGPVLTRWLADHRDMVDASLKMTPMERAATPEDIGKVIVHVGVEATLTTGQVLVVDGGRTM